MVPSILNSTSLQTATGAGLIPGQLAAKRVAVAQRPEHASATGPGPHQEDSHAMGTLQIRVHATPTHVIRQV